MNPIYLLPRELPPCDAPELPERDPEEERIPELPDDEGEDDLYELVFLLLWTGRAAGELLLGDADPERTAGELFLGDADPERTAGLEDLAGEVE